MSFINFLSGAAGGGAMAGPAGAALGGIQGLFGGDSSSRTSFDLRALTPGQKKIASTIEGIAPGLISRLSPDGQAKLLAEFEAAYMEQADREIKDTFDPARASFRSSMIRTGTGPASIMRDAMSKFAYDEGQARAGAKNQAKLAARSDLNAASASDQSALNTLTSILQNMYNGQAVGATQTTTQPGSGLMESLSGAGYALTSPFSYYSRSASLKKIGGGWAATPAVALSGPQTQGPSYFGPGG